MLRLIIYVFPLLVLLTGAWWTGLVGRSAPAPSDFEVSFHRHAKLLCRSLLARYKNPENIPRGFREAFDLAEEEVDRLERKYPHLKEVELKPLPNQPTPGPPPRGAENGPLAEKAKGGCQEITNRP
jgi:hypothetical protein